MSELIARHQTEAPTDWNRTANNKNVDVFMSQINNTHFIEDCPAWHFKKRRSELAFIMADSGFYEKHLVQVVKGGIGQYN